MKKYKKLMKCFLKELFTMENPSKEFIEQIILRYAYKDKYVVLDKETNEFMLSKKGEKFIER